MPDVLDAVVREEPLEVVLHQRIQHAQHRREPSHATTNTPHDSLGTPRPNAQTRTMP